MMYRGTFEIVFQPIVDIATRAVIAFEALSQFPVGASPLTHFVTTDREGGDVDLEISAITKAIDAARLLPLGIPITVNASPLTLEDPTLHRVLHATERPVGIEITEHHRVTNYPRLRAQIAKLDPSKVIADGAGSAHSTANHIRLLRPDTIKLSNSLTALLRAPGADTADIASLIAIARILGAEVLATQVDSDTVVTAALQLGIALGQGPLFGSPQPVSRIRK